MSPPLQTIHLEQAMVYGHPVLIQDVGEDLDPSLAAIFRMTGLDQERASMIQFGDKELSYNHNFRSGRTHTHAEYQRACSASHNCSIDDSCSRHFCFLSVSLSAVCT